MFLRLFKFSSAQKKHSIGVVYATVFVISLQALQIIVIRKPCSVPVLLNVHSCQVQLLVRKDVLRSFCCLRRLCKLWNPIVLFLISNKLFSLVNDPDPDLCPVSSRKGNTSLKHILWGNCHLLIQYFFSRICDDHICAIKLLRRVNTGPYLSFRNLKIDCSVKRGILDVTCLFVRHEILPEFLFLIWRKPRKIRLVVAVHSCHQFDVGTVFIRKISVPCLTEISASPGPLFLARRYVMICHMQKTCLFAVVVSAYEVKIGVLCHVRCGNRNISVP